MNFINSQAEKTNTAGKVIEAEPGPMIQVDFLSQFDRLLPEYSLCKGAERDENDGVGLRNIGKSFSISRYYKCSDC